MNTGTDPTFFRHTFECRGLNQVLINSLQREQALCRIWLQLQRADSEPRH